MYGAGLGRYRWSYQDQNGKVDVNSLLERRRRLDLDDL
jgi:hypothetical protein